uniref:Mediator of RNA polymerase II transcription subunit 15a-like n=1 Tax=Nelumbo nucifera TaxID=4432 RepID=A0A822ZCU8_NELNU|nr:TPA_asm: hypothetical protein HUJ06_001192 [Nelumbo nucifera]
MSITHYDSLILQAQSIKEIYLPDIKVLYQKITANLQKQDSLTQPPKSEQNSKLKTLKIMLDSFIHFLHLPKSNIGPSDKEKLDNFDRNIIGLLNSMRAKKHQLQSQIHLMPPHEKRMNTQMQPMNLQSSVTSIKPAAVTSMRHGSIPQSTSLGFPTAQPNMTSSLQNLESGQGNARSSLQQRVIGSLQHNTMITTQQENINSASQGPLMLRPKIYSYQPSSYMLQNQQLRQQQEQQVIQTQQLKQQCQQRQVHQQFSSYTSKSNSNL